MRTLIIGGGKGCRSLLDLTRASYLKEIHLDIVAVSDINPNAPGLEYARKIGLQTFSNTKEALRKLDVEVVIELTGQQDTIEELYRTVKPGTNVIEHSIAKIFWEIINHRKEKAIQIEEMGKLESKLKKERQFLSSIFDNLNDLAVVLDINNRIIRVNNKFAAFVGQEPGELLGRTCYEVLENTSLKCEKKEDCNLVHKIFENGESQTILRLTPPPDENHWEVNHSPIKNDKNEVVAVIASWHQITEKVQLHREIESAEHKFKSFIYSAQDWISIKNLDGQYEIVNPVTARAFHINPEFFIGKRPDEIFPGKLAGMILKHDQSVIKSKQYQQFVEIIPIDGQDHHFQTARFPLTDYKDEVIGVCTIARDITKEIKLQEQLRQSEKLAAIGKLAAGVAHEINNPLTGILAYAEDLMDEVPPDSFMLDDLKVIVRETLRCRDIVRNLLDFARQDKPDLEITDANQIINTTMNLIERLPQFKDITIVKELEQFLPRLQADPKQLQQVILNFMLNAADAMKFIGKITVSTDYDIRTGNCIVSVEDTGPGIPENLIDKIFEPFFSTKGTNGLGLAVSWGIVERHRGTIEIDTADSGGAIFRIVLPGYVEEE